jgi:hypothetical protein
MVCADRDGERRLVVLKIEDDSAAAIPACGER